MVAAEVGTRRDCRTRVEGGMKNIPARKADDAEDEHEEEEEDKVDGGPEGEGI